MGDQVQGDADHTSRGAPPPLFSLSWFYNAVADMERSASNRWLIAAAGVVMQIALGSVYAWSVFRDPLTSAYGWTISQVTLAFEIAILMLGFASFVGGLWMKRVGPRRVALLAGICYGLGVMLAGQAR